jgi:hypothetical protein
VINCTFVCIVLLSLYLTIVSLVVHVGHVQDKPMFTFVMFPIWLSPLCILAAVHMYRSRWNSKQELLGVEPSIQPLLMVDDMGGNGDWDGERRALHVASAAAASPSLGSSSVYGMTVLEAFRCISFWILTVIGLLLVGSGLAVINNLGQISTSLLGKAGSTAEPVLVTLLGSANSLGRLITGAVSECVHECALRAWPCGLVFSCPATPFLCAVSCA